ncbi:MAG TPA: YgcG family protein [Methylophilaceae bacterium]|nr:YgcG family protein [Methylophilaceae bacterium]
MAFAADEVAVPPLQQRVTDLTQTLGADQQAALESKLAQFEQQKGSQIAILLVPTTQPEAIEQYSIRVVEAWKLGRKGVDDGILILVAKADRKVRVEVGYGLEGIVPDSIASQIIRDAIQPHFKQGDFYGGLNAAVDQLIARINGEPLPAPERQAAASGGWEDLLPVLLFGGLLVGGLLRAIFGSFLGGMVNGGLVGAAVWLLGGGLLIAMVVAFVAFILTMSGGLGGLNGYSGGSHYGGGGFGSGGGFSGGGGGGFGGGGASGDW